MIWTDYFNLIKVLPGRIVTPRFGTLDFADPNLQIEKVQALYDGGFPYLQVTQLGIKELYPENNIVKVKQLKNPPSGAKTAKLNGKIVR